MTPFVLTASMVLMGLAAAGGLGWLQWLMLKRVLGRPNRWVTTSVVGAAVSTPLSTGLVLDTLARAGLPPDAALPVGLGLLGAQLVLGTLGVAGVAWTLGRR
jgi:hypothetical protein